MTFKDLNILAPILQALDTQHYSIPTLIQRQAIPSVLAGRDLLGCAQTGTGKTAAFAIPLLQLLHGTARPTGNSVRALVLAPTRELAIQIEENFHAYGRKLPLRIAAIFGGVSQVGQINKLKNGTDILVATPGRLLDLMQQGYADISRIGFLILDEADRMLDMGFIHDVKKILKAVPQKRQTLFFSATMPSAISKLADGILTDPMKITVTPVSSTTEAVGQSVYFVDKQDKRKLLSQILKDDTIIRSLVYNKTKFV